MRLSLSQKPLKDFPFYVDVERGARTVQPYRREELLCEATEG